MYSTFYEYNRYRFHVKQGEYVRIFYISIKKKLHITNKIKKKMKKYSKDIKCYRIRKTTISKRSMKE